MSESLVVGDQSGLRDIFLRDREAPLEPFCAGDGSLPTGCPCGNQGLPGHGCESSAGTGGATLVASGGTSPDTVALSAAGLPDGGLALAPAGPFDPPTTHRSATLGDPFGPGATRAYQVVDRDDAGGFCPPGSFNATNAVRVSW